MPSINELIVSRLVFLSCVNCQSLVCPRNPLASQARECLTSNAEPRTRLVLQLVYCATIARSLLCDNLEALSETIQAKAESSPLVVCEALFEPPGRNWGFCFLATALTILYRANHHLGRRRRIGYGASIRDVWGHYLTVPSG